MKIEVGIFKLMGAHISAAFVPSSYIGSEAGDQLLAEIWERLRHLTAAPLMLYSTDGRGHAAYQTHEFVKRIRREHAEQIVEIDLTKPFYEYQGDAPF